MFCTKSGLFEQIGMSLITWSILVVTTRRVCVLRTTVVSLRGSRVNYRVFVRAKSHSCLRTFWTYSPLGRACGASSGALGAGGSSCGSRTVTAMSHSRRKTSISHCFTTESRYSGIVLNAYAMRCGRVWQYTLSRPDVGLQECSNRRPMSKSLSGPRTFPT